MAKRLLKSAETPNLELSGNMPGLSKSVHVPQACQNISQCSYRNTASPTYSSNNNSSKGALRQALLAEGSLSIRLGNLNNE